MDTSDLAVRMKDYEKRNRYYLQKRTPVAIGQANFSHRELQNKSCSMIQDMLHEQKGINWNDFPTQCKRGTACRKVKQINDDVFTWEIDYEMPILKGEDREYVEKLISGDE